MVPSLRVRKRQNQEKSGALLKGRNIGSGERDEWGMKRRKEEATDQSESTTNFLSVWIGG